MSGSRQLAVLLAFMLLMGLLAASPANANFGVHGAFTQDTDACAGCHRVHTSYSTLTWSDVTDTKHSALLISAAATMQEFCYSCHADGAPGASTNVLHGVFDSGPSGSIGVPLGGATRYQTNSSFDATLNGGGFTAFPSGDAVTSVHTMEAGALTDPMWGAGSSAPTGVNLMCISCHDVHGSSNYRILRDQVAGVTVGGFDASGTPLPFVYSSEENYPADGWRKHDPGVAQMAAYRPNYTTPEYQFSGPATYTAGRNRSMSTWCAACHTHYVVRGDAVAGSAPYDHGTYEAAANNGALLGPRGRHRHPVDAVVATVTVAGGWGSDAVTSSVLPLDKRPGATEPRGTWALNDYMGCLTCHFAHGTSATMTGWANSRLVNRPTSVVTWSVEPTIVPPAGVNPGLSSALLRAPNRGVCERCHNK